MLGIIQQLLSLLVAVTPALWDRFVSRLTDDIITYSLVCGLAASRFGLWTFDLAVSQRLQTDIAEHELGEFISALTNDASD